VIAASLTFLALAMVGSAIVEHLVSARRSGGHRDAPAER
jgi:hypothetical protein